MSKLHVKHNLIELSFLHTCKPACFFKFLSGSSVYIITAKLTLLC